MPLTSEQFNELVEQYAEIVVDRMSVGTMEQFIFDELVNRYTDLSETDLRETINETEDALGESEGLFDELVDNVTNDTVLDINETGGQY